MVEQPLYAPARNLTWILIVLAAMLIIYVFSKTLKKKK